MCGRDSHMMMMITIIFSVWVCVCDSIQEFWLPFLSFIHLRNFWSDSFSVFRNNDEKKYILRIGKKTPPPDFFPLVLFSMEVFLNLWPQQQKKQQKLNMTGIIIFTCWHYTRFFIHENSEKFSKMKCQFFSS